MAFADIYRRQVALLVRALPFVTDERVFALKGGTAINLFIRNMPRLSVDIDLTYLPVAPRAQSLAEIDAALKRIADRISANIPNARIAFVATDEMVRRLNVRLDDAQIKIEVTPVLRGCVFEPELRAVSAAVEDAFGFAEARVVSFPDLYAGKLVAALDRQHPRDLFDVRDLLASEGISDELRQAFVVYLISHSRPMSEVLAPTRKDIRQAFERGFAGMTAEPVVLDDLLETREAMIAAIVGAMPAEHRAFLISFEAGNPDWALLDLKGIADLPAVKWRQENLDKLTKEKRRLLVDELASKLSER